MLIAGAARLSLVPTQNGQALEVIGSVGGA
jgi:hypothetical protein